MAKDGSSTAFLYMDELDVCSENGHITIRIGAGHDITAADMLKARVGKGRTLLIQSRENAVLFSPGMEAKVTEEDDMVTLTLPAAAFEELCGRLQSHAGIYPMTASPVTIEVVPTKIKDANGNVIKVIG